MEINDSEKEKVNSLRSKGLTLYEAINAVAENAEMKRELSKHFSKEFDGNHWD